MMFRLIVLFVLCAFTFTGNPSQAFPVSEGKTHPFAAECVIGEQKKVLLDSYKSWSGTILQYDRNGDGRLDYQERMPLRKPFPDKFWIDTDFNGEPDRVVIDVAGDGRCEDMRLLDPTHPEYLVGL